MLLEVLGSNYNKSVDYKIIETQDGKKNISIDQIRSIDEFIISKPIENNKKVICIKCSENLSVEAQNALLKTLEEPPVYLEFILEAQRLKSLLPTIISRCISIELGASESINIEAENNSNNVDEILNLLKLDIGKRIDWTIKNKDLVKDSDAFYSYLDSWEVFLRDVLVYDSFDQKLIKNKYKIREIDSLQDKIEKKDLMQIMNNIIEAKSFAGSNVNKSLVVENFLLNLPVLND